MVLNVGLDISLANMKDREGTREKVGDEKSARTYITHDGDLPLSSQRVLY
jgi:hypothetical protein